MFINEKETSRVDQIKRKLLITGCGRSGTKYTSLVLRNLGLDIGHEQMGNDGVASWYLAVSSNEVPFGDVASNIAFEHVFHQIRHPLKVISSATTFAAESWDFICQRTSIDINEPLILRCAKYWLYWNLEAEKCAEWHYRIEDFQDVFHDFCARLNIPADESVLKTLSPDTNTRKHGWYYHAYQEISHRIGLPTNRIYSKLIALAMIRKQQTTINWNDLKLLDARLAKMIWDKSCLYGYTD